MKQRFFLLKAFATLSDFYNQRPERVEVYQTEREARQAGNNLDCLTFDIEFV